MRWCEALPVGKFRFLSDVLGGGIRLRVSRLTTPSGVCVYRYIEQGRDLWACGVTGGNDSGLLRLTLRLNG